MKLIQELRKKGMKKKIEKWDSDPRLKGDKEYLKLRKYYLQHRSLIENYVDNKLKNNE